MHQKSKVNTDLLVYLAKLLIMPLFILIILRHLTCEHIIFYVLGDTCTFKVGEYIHQTYFALLPQDKEEEEGEREKFYSFCYFVIFGVGLCDVLVKQDCT